MTYISLSIISLYILFYLVKYKKIPNSLSATYYDLGQFFSLTLVVCTILILPDMFRLTSGNYAFLPFLSLIGVLFVAFSPNFKDSQLVDHVHTGFALMSLVFSQIWVGLINPIIFLVWIPVILYGLYGIYKKINILELPQIKFWAEITMLISVYSILLDNF